MSRIIKKLPKKANYLYTTEDIFGLHKLYRSKKNLYLISTTSDGVVIRSYSVDDLNKLSTKLYDYAEQLEEQDSDRES